MLAIARIRIAASVATGTVENALPDRFDVFFDMAPKSAEWWEVVLEVGFPANVRRIAFRLFAIAIVKQPSIACVQVEHPAAYPRVTRLITEHAITVIIGIRLSDLCFNIVARKDLKTKQTGEKRGTGQQTHWALPNEVGSELVSTIKTVDRRVLVNVGKLEPTRTSYERGRF